MLMGIVKMVPELKMVAQQILNVGFQSMEFATLTLQTVEGKRQLMSLGECSFIIITTVAPRHSRPHVCRR